MQAGRERLEKLLATEMNVQERQKCRVLSANAHPVSYHLLHGMVLSSASGKMSNDKFVFCENLKN